MRLVTPATLSRDAGEKGYGIPALNTNGANYEITRACLEAANELNSPVILQVYEPNSGYRGYRYLIRQVESLVDELAIRVPVAVQLDHGKSVKSCLEAMRAGFSGVMIDASHKPLPENIDLTNQVVPLAHALDVSVEAEIGHVGGNEAPEGPPPVGRAPVPATPTTPPEYTDPDDVAEFLDATQVDLLAVSIGTEHGLYESQTAFDLDLLARLAAVSNVPLVQHGTGGISLEDLGRLVKNGMAKVNFGEPLRYNYIRYFVEAVDSIAHQWHTWRIMVVVKEKLKKDVCDIIQAVGSVDKA